MGTLASEWGMSLFSVWAASVRYLSVAGLSEDWDPGSEKICGFKMEI